MSNRRDFCKRLLVVGAGLSFPYLSIGKSKTLLTNKMELSFRPFDALLKYPFTVAGYTRTTTPIVLTEIRYNGLVGYGEASLPPYLGETQESVMAFLKKVNLSQFSSPFLLSDILSYVDKIAKNNTAAKASIDIALHDLIGKLLGQPLYKIFGYNPQNTPDTSFTIGMDTEEIIRKKTSEALDYNILKVKLGSSEDKKLIEAIRSVTHKPICVDVNQGWTDKHYALEMIHYLKAHNVVFVEQPMPVNYIDQTAWLTEKSPLPVMADESCQRLDDVVKLKGVFSGINIKLMKCTGLYEAQKMMTVAKTLQMKVMVGCMTETSCAVSAMAQLSPEAEWADLDGNLLITNDCFSGVTIEKGKITLSDKPGIGLT